MSTQHEGLSGPSPEVWAMRDGQSVHRITLSSDGGIACAVSNFGASLLELTVPTGNPRVPNNVVLGYDTFEQYEHDPFFLGVTVGRVANRIAGGRFSLNGREFQLETNDGIDHLHGGSRGLGKRIWKVERVTPRAATFHLDSPVGDSGYPGAVALRVTYRLEESRLGIEMEASSDDDTIVNLAHHSYFDLEGQGDNRGHLLELCADEYTPGAPHIPDGRVVSVEGTPLDFRKARALGELLPQIPGAPRGFDHNLLVRGASSYTAATSASEPMRPIATVTARQCGRVMKLFSNQPCVQLYGGNYLDGRANGARRPLSQYAGFCLETQACPNAINVPDLRGQVVLPAGRTYRHTMLYEFSGPT